MNDTDTTRPMTLHMHVIAARFSVRHEQNGSLVLTANLPGVLDSLKVTIQGRALTVSTDEIERSFTVGYEYDLDKIEAKLALPEKDHRRCRNPFGLLVMMLGAEVVRPSQPIEPDLHHVTTWDRREEFAIKQARAQIAMQAAVDDAIKPDGKWTQRITKLGGGA